MHVFFPTWYYWFPHPSRVSTAHPKLPGSPPEVLRANSHVQELEQVCMRQSWKRKSAVIRWRISTVGAAKTVVAESGRDTTNKPERHTLGRGKPGRREGGPQGPTPQPVCLVRANFPIEPSFLQGFSLSPKCSRVGVAPRTIVDHGNLTQRDTVGVPSDDGRRCRGHIEWLCAMCIHCK